MKNIIYILSILLMLCIIAPAGISQEMGLNEVQVVDNDYTWWEEFMSKFELGFYVTSVSTQASTITLPDTVTYGDTLGLSRLYYVLVFKQPESVMSSLQAGYLYNGKTYWGPNDYVSVSHKKGDRVLLALYNMNPNIIDKNVICPAGVSTIQYVTIIGRHDELDATSNTWVKSVYGAGMTYDEVGQIKVKCAGVQECTRTDTGQRQCSDDKEVIQKLVTQTTCAKVWETAERCLYNQQCQDSKCVTIAGWKLDNNDVCSPNQDTVCESGKCVANVCKGGLAQENEYCSAQDDCSQELKCQLRTDIVLGKCVKTEVTTPEVPGETTPEVIPSEIKDADGDGVTDDVDVCPIFYGTQPNGCPTDECTTNENCKEDYECQSGFCVPKQIPCSKSGVCPTDFECVNDACVEKPSFWQWLITHPPLSWIINLFR